MEFGGEMQGSPSPGNRPKGDPNRELGSRNQVSMGPTSKTPLTQRLLIRTRHRVQYRFLEALGVSALETRNNSFL